MMIVLVGASLGTAARADKLPQYQQGWWQQVAAAIAASEYDIRGGGDARLLAVNRAQELRADFSATGASVTPRSAQDPGWSLGISLLGVEQYGALVPAAAGERTAADRTVTYSRDDIVETWTNEENGILLDVALSGSALLGNNSQLAFRLDTNLAAVVSDSASQIDFYADGVRVARLGLRASTPGAGGKPTAQLEGNRLLILAPKTPGIVNKVSMALTTAAGEDTGVGPSTTADSILNEEQPDSNFALSVAAAGDVNKHVPLLHVCAGRSRGRSRGQR